MKKYIVTLISLFGFCIAQAQAQTLTFGPLHSADSPRADWLLPGDTIMQAGQKDDLSGKTNEEREIYSQFTFLE